ncbi:MAG: DHA2 family efflux MFS transporter permease subunit [Acidobacteria bacterium]|nr:DHA2 family efflux MFS transporter permease subunit [Acidobacteriota bacterium]
MSVDPKAAAFQGGAGSDSESGDVHPWLEALAVMAGTFMVVLDSTVVNVSLPHIAGSLSASIEESTWALTTYLAANAVILPITGWLANFFGRKRLLLLSVVGFTLTSVLCGMAPTLSFLIACRIVQGATGGVMQPLSQAIMLEAFPPRKRGQAMAFWGIGIVVAPILGPLLGGWLTENLSWRWVFYINVPVGIISFLMVEAFIFDPPYIRRSSARVDWWGLTLLGIGIAALQIGLDQGQKEDWLASSWIVALLVIAAAGLIGLIIRELLVSNPIVDFRIFRERSYTAGVLLMTLLGFVLYGSLVVMPVMLQTLLGYSAVEAGNAMAPRGVGTLLVMPFVGVMIGRLDPRKILAAGFVLTAVTFFWLGQLNMNAGYWDIFWPQVFQGMGLGMLFTPLATVSMDRISREHMGNATSLFNLMRNIGGAAGIAVVQTVLARQRQMHTNVLVAHITGYDVGSQQFLAAMKSAFVARGTDAVTAVERSYGAAFGLVQQQATMMAFIDVFWGMGLVFVILLPLILLMRRPAHHEHSPIAAPD